MLMQQLLDTLLLPEVLGFIVACCSVAVVFRLILGYCYEVIDKRKKEERAGYVEQVLAEKWGR